MWLVWGLVEVLYGSEGIFCMFWASPNRLVFNEFWGWPEAQKARVSRSIWPATLSAE